MSDLSNNLLWNNFERAFRPKSVAILGASNDATRISGRALHYMKKAGYQGRIYPVNPTRDTVQDIKALSNLPSREGGYAALVHVGRSDCDEGYVQLSDFRGRF